MSPAIGPAAPATTNPLQFDIPGSGVGTPQKSQDAGGSHGVGQIGDKASVRFGTAGTGAADAKTDSSKASLTNGSSLPVGPGELSASTQRLIDMAIAETKDGPAASFLAKVLIKQAGEQRDQNMRDMMAARQTALSLTLAAASELKKAGQDLEKAAVTGFALGLAGSICSFGTKAEKDIGETRPKIAATGRGLSAGGEFAGTQGQVNSKSDEAQQKVDEANSEQANMVADRKKDAMEKIDDLAKQVIEFLRAFQETNNDMMAAITRG